MFGRGQKKQGVQGKFACPTERFAGSIFKEQGRNKNTARESWGRKIRMPWNGYTEFMQPSVIFRTCFP